MHGAAMPLVSRIERTLVGIEAGVLGQQGRVNIENPAAVVGDEPGTQDAHETGKDDEFRRIAVEFGGYGAVEGLAVRERPMFDDRGGNAGPAGPL